MDIDGVASRQVVAELTNSFHERHGLDVTNRAADLADHEIVVLVPFEYELLDLVRNVGNDLHSSAKIVAASLTLDDRLVDPTSRDVVIAIG